MLVNNLFKYWTYRVFAPGAVLRSTYESFQKLLEYDGQAHESMAELEALYYQGRKEDLCSIRNRYESLAANVLGMVESLEQMTPGAHVTLKSYFKKFDFYSKFLLAPPSLDSAPPFVCSVQDGMNNDHLVGGKASQLASLALELDLRIPEGFVITTNSFNYFMAYNDLRRPVDEILCTIESGNPTNLIAASEKLIDLIMNGEVPSDIADEVMAAWNNFVNKFDEPPLVAVRSSCLNEDGACSFAGQYLTLLNISGEQLLNAWLRVVSSKYTPEALAYRIHSGLGDEETGMAVLVLEMVDAKASGVMYTADPSGGDKNKFSIHVVRGHGDALVSGRVIPESFDVNAKSDTGGTDILTKSEFDELCKQGMRFVDIYPTPRDIEWSITEDGCLIFLQCRPLEIQQIISDADNVEPLAENGQLLFQAGVTAAIGQACGPAYVVDFENSLEKVPNGAILVLSETLPSAVRVLKQVSGVVAELGSVAGHFSTVCREFGVPLILAVGDKVGKITHGEELSLFADIQELWQGNCLPEVKTEPLYTVQKDLPYFRRLRGLLGFITPLNLLDPEAKNFVPESCRSLHDIIRFSHEQAVQTMFSLGDRGSGRSKGKRKLRSDLPLDVFLIDVGGGLEVKEKDSAGEDVSLDEVCCPPFRALWQGLTHPSVEWGERSHFDWKSFDEINLAGGSVSMDASEFASFAVLGENYVNLNMRFGYHFTLVDAMCDSDAAKNYCQLRFAGGGGDFSGRSLRIDFVETILRDSGFEVKPRGDLLDARIQHMTAEKLLQKLKVVGRLLGVTKLMDMRLKDEAMVKEQVKAFLTESA